MAWDYQLGMMAKFGSVEPQGDLPRKLFSGVYWRQGVLCAGVGFSKQAWLYHVVMVENLNLRCKTLSTLRNQLFCL